MARVFSREEFYDLVWSRPMTHLAKEFALSDVALHKICRKHDIPNPPPGWWARKAAGKNVKQVPLPAAGGGTPETITIAGAELRREPAPIAAAREQARLLAASIPADGKPSPHPIVDRTIAALRKAKKAGPTGLVAVSGERVIKCEVAPVSIDRLEDILCRVTTAAAQQGFRLAFSDGTCCFMGDEESIAFSVSEAARRVPHELTDRERAEQEKWQLGQERRRLRNEWTDFVSRPRFPEWDYQPTGRLSLEFEHVYAWSGQSPRRSFRDAKIQRLENMASDIAVGLAVLAAAKTAERLRREAEQRRADEQRRQRELALRAKHIEERRRSALDILLDEAWHADRLRRLLTGLRQGDSGATDPRVSEFIRWSEHHLARCEAALDLAELGKRFEEQRLFGDDDDHAFYPPHWY